jgi:hypothetical protein
MFGSLHLEEDGHLEEEVPKDGIANYNEVDEDIVGEVLNFNDEEVGYVDFLGVDDILSNSYNNDCDEFYAD